MLTPAASAYSFHHITRKAIGIQKQLNRILVNYSGQTFPELTSQREILDILVLLNNARKKEGIPVLTLPNITLHYLIQLVNSGLLEKVRCYTFYPRQQGLIYCSVAHELNLTLLGYCEVVETNREKDMERFCVG